MNEAAFLYPCTMDRIERKYIAFLPNYGIASTAPQSGDSSPPTHEEWITWRKFSKKTSAPSTPANAFSHYYNTLQVLMLRK